MVYKLDPEEVDPAELFKYSRIGRRDFAPMAPRGSGPSAPRWLPTGIIDVEDMEDAARRRNGGRDVSPADVVRALRANLTRRPVLVANEFREQHSCLNCLPHAYASEALLTHVIQLEGSDINAICRKVQSILEGPRADARWCCRIKLLGRFKLCDVFIARRSVTALLRAASWPYSIYIDSAYNLFSRGLAPLFAPLCRKQNWDIKDFVLTLGAPRRGEGRNVVPDPADLALGPPKPEQVPDAATEGPTPPRPLSFSGDDDPVLRPPLELDEDNIREFLALGPGLPLHQSIDLVQDTGRFLNYHHLIQTRATGIELGVVRVLTAANPDALTLGFLEEASAKAREDGEDALNAFLRDRCGKDLTEAPPPTY